MKHIVLRRFVSIVVVFTYIIVLYTICASAEVDQLYAQDKNDIGTYGKFIVPDLSISIALDESIVGVTPAQAIVDQPDLAAYIHWGSVDAIADHGNGNFLHLVNAVPGKTVALIDHNNQSQMLICVDNQVGHLKERTGLRRGRDLYDSNWEYVYDKNDGGIISYCCLTNTNEEGITDVALIYWQPVSGIEYVANGVMKC